jgi:hypothetical protein
MRIASGQSGGFFGVHNIVGNASNLRDEFRGRDKALKSADSEHEILGGVNRPELS